MATRPNSISPFVAQLLAPLPEGVEQVDSRSFRRSMEEDADKALSIAIATADHRKALADVYHCETMIVAATQGETARLARLDHYHHLWNYYRAMTLAVAETPALTKKQIERKKRAIGRVWLEADTGGDGFYEALRAGVAADEASLAAK